MSTTIVLTESRNDQQPPSEAKKFPEPLLLTGALEKLKHEELTPVIGREYPDVNLVDDLINATNSDELLRDLAITSKSRIPIDGIESILTVYSLSKRCCFLPCSR